MKDKGLEFWRIKLFQVISVSTLRRVQWTSRRLEVSPMSDIVQGVIVLAFKEPRGRQQTKVNKRVFWETSEVEQQGELLILRYVQGTSKHLEVVVVSVLDIEKNKEQHETL
jgi:hypothetical protein